MNSLPCSFSDGQVVFFWAEHTFQFCWRRTIHIDKSHSEKNTAILPFACTTMPMHSYTSLGNYPQTEVSTFLRLVTHVCSLVIPSCLQTDIPQKEYLQGVQNPSAYTNAFITPIFLPGIHFCWFVFNLGAIIKIPNHTICRLLHIETRKDNPMKRFMELNTKGVCIMLSH